MSFLFKTKYAEAGPDNNIKINAGSAASAKNASDAYPQTFNARLSKLSGARIIVNGNSLRVSKKTNNPPAKILGIIKGIVILHRVSQYPIPRPLDASWWRSRKANKLMPSWTCLFPPLG